MADGIQISTQVLLDTAEKVRTINTTLDSKLADINKNMNDLEATWKSDAASDIRAVDVWNTFFDKIQRKIQ